MRRAALILVPYLWLLALFLVPFLIVFKISLSDIALAIPPYTPTLDLSEGWQGIRDFVSRLDFENFVFLTTDDLYWRAYLSSVQIAVIATVLTLLVGYPIAYGMASAPDHWRPTLMMLVILPFWTSFPHPRLFMDGDPVDRRLSQPGPAGPRGDIEPLTILNTNTAVYIGIVYTYMPFMILPIYSTLDGWTARFWKRPRIWAVRGSRRSG